MIDFDGSGSALRNAYGICCRRAWLGFVLALSLALAAAAPCWAEDTPKNGSASVAAELEAERAKLAKDLEALAARNDLPETERAGDRETLESLDRALVRHLETLREAPEADAGALPEEIERQLAGGPPFSIGDLDAVLDSREAARSAAARLSAAAEFTDAEVEAAREAQQEAETQRRRAREALETAEPTAPRAALEAALRRSELESRRAEVELALDQGERMNAKHALEEARRRSAALDAAAQRVRDGLAGEPDELATRLAQLEKRRDDLQRQLQAAQLEVETAGRRFRTVQRRVDTETTPTSALREEAAARRAELATARREAALLEERAARLDRSAELWRRREALAAGGVSGTEVKTWLEESRADAEEAERKLRLAESRRDELRDELESARREAAAATGAEARWLVASADAVAERASLYDEEARSLREAKVLAQRLVGDLEHGTQALSLGEQLARLQAGLGEAWRYEITESEDRPITVGKIVTALLVFVLGWLLARVVAWGVGRKLLPRLRFDEGAAQAFQSLTFYFLLLFVFYAALRSVNIPLTAFAVVGGALAIGIGFGSQNVVSNFISGLILLAERPLKVGDLVEVDGTYGIIESVGLRSTRVRSGDNVHIIVPNSAFLENKVINWTHNDPNVRIWLSVGVAYGSPTREVERLIKQALAEHPRVLDTPEPVVLFKEFGDNALVFDAAFWIRMRRVLDRLFVESDVRFRINDLFNEAGIVIAFPQRDVHLDSLRPVEVRLVDGREKPSES